MNWQPINEVEAAKANRKSRQAFYTPLSLVSLLVEHHLQPWTGGRYLEPSAGDGRMVHAIRSACSDCVIDACEIEPAMHERLEQAGATVVAQDFLRWSPGEVYDGVLMNPPFNNKQDAKHIEHAYSLLRPGGRLVAVASDRLPDQLIDRSLNLPGCTEARFDRVRAGEFKEFGTNVKTSLVFIEKPLPGEDDGTDRIVIALSTWIGSRASCADRWKGIENAEQLRAKYVKPLAEAGCTTYGVDWGRVWNELAIEDGVPMRKVRRSAKQMPLLAMGDLFADYEVVG